MNDAKSRFFASMEREMEDDDDGPTASERSTKLDIDFSVTESGRTVAHMVTDTNRSIDMDFSITESGRSTGDMSYMGLTESDRDVLLQTFGPEGTTSSSTLDNHPVEPPTASQAPSLPPVNELRQSSARAIPVPTAPSSKFQQQQSQQRPNASASSQQQQQQQQQPPSSQPNSYNSTGSAFLSSVLNPNPAQQNHQQQQVAAHTPPAASSYEVSHFGKRARAGSVSGKLRSASDYLEEKGLLDRQTKGILNDLLIMGDEEMQQALDRYEAGDPSLLEQMIQSGALQNRLPKDIDILGGLGDFDFLSVHDGGEQMGEADIIALEAQQEKQQQQQQQALKNNARQTAGRGGGVPQSRQPQRSQSQPIPVHPGGYVNGMKPAMGTRAGSVPPPYMVSPQHQQQYDDGIGELDFAGDFVSDQTQNQYDMMNFNQPQSFGSTSQANPSAAASPAEMHQMTEYERRNRSNSLFSALLNNPNQNQNLPVIASTNNNNMTTGAEPRVGSHQSHASQATHASHATHNTAARQYGEWLNGGPMDNNTAGGGSNGVRPGQPMMGQAYNQQPPQQYPEATGIHVAGGPRIPPSGAHRKSGIGASLEQAERKRTEQELREQKRREKERKQQERRERKERKQQEKAAAAKTAAEEDEAREEHIPGCGRPRALSDPNLKATVDSTTGLLEVERPDGWVGAYSPESRKVRLERFMEKRKHRVWQQTVKYDVRKNFADSRLRVKGRFVKKEDEMIMRELMSLT